MAKTKNVPAAPIDPGAAPIPATTASRIKHPKRTRSSSPGPSKMAHGNAAGFSPTQSALITKLMIETGSPSASRAQNLERFLSGVKSIAAVL